jgi:hypothetical protein
MLDGRDDDWQFAMKGLNNVLNSFLTMRSFEGERVLF